MVSSRKLFDRLRNEDTESWKIIYREHKSRVINMVLKNSGDLEEAEDLFQDVMISFYHNLQRKKVRDDSNLKSYIDKIASNQWRSKLGRGKKNPVSNTSNDMILEGTGNEEEETIDYNEKLDVILENMKEKCREILHLRYSTVKMSMAEIAKRCGFSNARSATSQLNKCMNSAKELALTL